MQVGMIQMDIASGEKERNIRHAFELMEEAALKSDLLVLPEFWTVGYDFRNIHRQASCLGDDLLQRLGEFAKYHQVTIAAGTVPLIMGEKLYNTALIVSPDGTVQAHYEKRRLFDAYLEGDLMEPGTQSIQTEIRGIQSGIAVCYELYFPELFLEMALKGTTLVLVPASWPLKSIGRWEILNRARAIENGIYICAVNMTGAYHGIKFGGHSMFVDPEGNVLARAGTGEEICYGFYDETKYPNLGSQLAVIQPVKNKKKKEKKNL